MKGDDKSVIEDRPDLLFVGAFPPPESQIYGGMVTSCRALLQSSLPERVRLHLLDSTQKTNPPPSLLSRLRYAALRFGRFLRDFERHKPRVVMLFMSAGASVVEKGVMAWYARARGCPAIVFPRAGAIVDAGRASVAYCRFLRVCFGGARSLVCQSDVWREFAVEKLGFDPADVTIVRNWTATPDLLAVGANRGHSSQSPVQLIFVGWVERKKGVMELLESCRQLDASCDFTLTVVGDGNAMREARAFVTANELQSRVSFAGWLEAADVTSALGRADVFVLPSWAEGLPNALVEAMAAGTAVVVSNVGAIPDFIVNRTSGLIVPPRDPEALAGALAEIIGNSALRIRLAAEGHQLAASEFGVEQAVAKILQVIDDVVGKEKQA